MGADPFAAGGQSRRGNRRTDHDAYRIPHKSLASMTTTLASAIESTIDSAFAAARRLHREDIRRLTPPAGRRAMPLDGRQPLTPNAPHLTERTPDGRSARSPLSALRN